MNNLSKKELDSWRLIITTLVNYGLYDLLEDEIATIAVALNRRDIGDE